MVTDEVLVPNYMSLLDLLPLLLTSKRLRNKINERTAIAQHIRTKLGIPSQRMRRPIKVTTVFEIRGYARGLPFNLRTEYGCAIRDCCAVCLRHRYVTLYDSPFPNGRFLFTNGIEACNCPWNLRKSCKHASHIHTRLRCNGQKICTDCMP